MKILFCNYEYPPLGGGGGVVNAMLAEEMSKKHEVVVLTSKGPGLKREEVTNGVRVIRVPVYFRKRRASSTLVSMLAFLPMGYYYGRKLIEQETFDAINTHFVLPTGPVGHALARHAKIPNLLSLHGGDLYDPSKFTSPHRHPILKSWVKYLLRSADCVIGQSTNTLNNMKTIYTPELQGMLIPLGINRPEVSGKGRKEYGFSDQDILLVTVGRLIRRKGLPQLIEMMKTIPDPRVKLLLVGSGPVEAELREAVRQNNLGSRVCFLGFVEESDKFAILRMSDVFVSTTQHEGFCLAFMEAMSMGLPVVTYDHGGHTDYLVDGKTGYLVPLNDLETFRSRCQNLIHHPALRQEIGVLNTRLVENYFIDNCARQYESAFLAAVDARSKVEVIPDAVPITQSPGFLNKAVQGIKAMNEKQSVTLADEVKLGTLKEKVSSSRPSIVSQDEG